MNGNTSLPQPLLDEALRHLEMAIDLLDRASAPGHIAAHADLALNQLQGILSEGANVVPLHPDEPNSEIPRALSCH